MTAPIRVWITGVGGDLGQALVKALRLSAKSIQFYGSDLSDRGIGSAFVDQFYRVPRADDPAYVPTLDHLCQQMQIEVVIPGSEPEIWTLSQLGDPPQLPCGVPVLCQPHRWIQTYGDKLTCMQAIAPSVPLAPFADGHQWDAVQQVVHQAGFPLIVKERRSSGSKGIHRVQSLTQLQAALAATQHPLVQGFIDDEGGEFSVGVFATPTHIHTVVFTRTLGPGGCSWYAETREDNEVEAYAQAIAHHTQATGSLNIQVRKSSQGVRLLEINPRFSSLVAARAACGFRDLEWSLNLALGDEMALVPVLRPMRFQRFVDDLVDFGSGFGRLSAWNVRHTP